MHCLELCSWRLGPCLSVAGSFLNPPCLLMGVVVLGLRSSYYVGGYAAQVHGQAGTTTKALMRLVSRQHICPCLVLRGFVGLAHHHSEKYPRADVSINLSRYMTVQLLVSCAF